MKTIYIDSDFKCYITNDNTMTAIETDFFDNKCDTFIEGYRFIPNGEKWINPNGKTFYGEMISPWKNFKELDIAQREYEKQLIAEYEAELAELDAVLLEVQYQNLIAESE